MFSAWSQTAFRKQVLKMKTFKAAALSLVLAACASPIPAWAADADNQAITKTLKQYEAALNKGDVGAIADLYTEDGVQMPPNAPAAVGSEAIEASYTATFQAISINLDFTVDEINLLDPDDAVMRTHSNGTVKINGSDQPAAPGAFKELWVLHQVEAGIWKFTHYSFSAVAAN
jgi:uncharacterized protein (TIGR02246 family)